MQPVVFSAAWFAQHQRALLWLLNAPVIGRWFRWVLCIRRHDIGYRARIIQILPHAYRVVHTDGTQAWDFRTHPKYGKRLYYAFAPLWWAMHAWDWAVADRWVPVLSFGFDTLTAYPDAGSPGTTTCDGVVLVFDDGTEYTWAGIRAATANTVQQTNSSDVWIYVVSAGTTDRWIRLGRSFALFDTSALSGATVTDATVSIYGTGKTDSASLSPDIDLYAATPASNTALATGDYANIGTTSQTGAPVSYASWNTSGYNDFTCNATGRGTVNTSGITRFGFRNANYDVANVAPTWSAFHVMSFDGYTADQTGSANDPKLVVTFTPQGRNRVALDQNRLSGVGNFTNSASTSLAFSSAVSAGQLLTLCITGGSSNGSSGVWVSTVTDTVNTAGKWQRAVRQASTVGGSSLRAEIWYAPNSSAGTPTVTVALASTAAGRFLFGIQSWSLASTIAADVLGSVASTAGNSSNLTTPTLSSLSSGSIVISCWKTSAGVTNRTNPTGWSTIAPQNSTRENTFYQLQTSTTPVSTKWQISAAAQYVVAMAEFRGSTFTPSTAAGPKPDGCAMLRMGVC